MIKSLGYSFSSMTARLLSGLVGVVFIARLLGPSEFGQYAVILSLGTLASFVLDAGMALRSLREIAAVPDHAGSIVHGDMKLKAALLAPYLLIGAVIASARGGAESALAAAIILFGMILSSTGDYFSSVLRGLKLYKVEAVSSVVANTVGAAALLLPVLVWHSVLAAAVGQLAFRVIALAAPAVSVAFFARLPSRTTGEVEPLFALARRTAIYAVDVLLNLATGQIDIILASVTLPLQAVGAYAVIGRIFQVSAQVMGTLSVVMIPALSAQSHAAPEVKRSHARQSLVFSLLLSTAAIGIAVLGPLIGDVALGPKYALLRPIWPWVGLGLLARAVSSFTAQPLTAFGLQKVRVQAQVVALPIYVGAALLAVPHYGLPGLVAAGALGYLAAAAVQIYGLSTLNFHPSWRSSVPVLAAVGVVFVKASLFNSPV